MARSRRVTVIVKSLNRFTEGVMTDITLEAVANLTAIPPGGTPIDLGWARNNWIPKIGSAAEAPVGTPDTTTPGAQQSGIATIVTAYRLRRGPIFISNNVPYIGFLNMGSSKQSPAGFIEAAIIRAVRTVATIPRAS